MTRDTYRIGTRGSPLALAQAEEVRARLVATSGRRPDAFEIVVIRTTGDRIQDRPLAEAGGKGLFTKEIEEALIAGSIDLAVHSMKDMPTSLPSGLVITAVLPREDVRDAFISRRATRFADLPRGAVVGTSSLRRAAQVRRRRPDLQVVPFRGNVDTRLRKLADGVADATFLAVAGLNRLGRAREITAAIDPADMLPAVAQGAVGVEVRSGDEETRHLLAPLNDEATALRIAAERAFLARLEGSCRTPIAALAELASGTLVVRGEILLPDGSQAYAGERRGTPAQALGLGEALAEDLLAKAGPEFFTRLG